MTMYSRVGTHYIKGLLRDYYHTLLWTITIHSRVDTHYIKGLLRDYYHTLLWTITIHSRVDTHYIKGLLRDYYHTLLWTITIHSKRIYYFQEMYMYLSTRAFKWDLRGNIHSRKIRYIQSMCIYLSTCTFKWEQISYIRKNLLHSANVHRRISMCAECTTRQWRRSRYAWRDTFIRVTWRDAFIRLTRLISMCAECTTRQWRRSRCLRSSTNCGRISHNLQNIVSFVGFFCKRYL